MTEDNGLPEEENRLIKDIMNRIEEIGRIIDEPLDPKIEPLLQVIHACLQEQLALGKRYKWGPRPSKDDEYFNQTDDVPSVEDLRRMMGEE